MEMHIAEWEKFSYIRGKTKPPIELKMDMKNGMLKIRKLRDEC